LKKIFLISIATDNPKLNKKIAEIAKNKGILINLAHQNNISDILIPASFKKEDYLISISTLGKSPLMAKKLKKRISQIISNEDGLWLKIQNYARNEIRKIIKNQKDREEFLKNLLKNRQLQDFISKNDENKAIEYVKLLITKLD